MPAACKQLLVSARRAETGSLHVCTEMDCIAKIASDLSKLGGNEMTAGKIKLRRREVIPGGRNEERGTHIDSDELVHHPIWCIHPV